MTRSFPTLSTPAGAVPATAPAWNRQRRSQMPSHRYRDVFARTPVPDMRDRSWPDARIAEAPLWVPVDLRDGNQALVEPMDPARKRRFFELMVAMGYMEIEVGYPSASRTDFDFVRLLAAGGVVPEDVTIVVFTPARADLIARTVESIEGCAGEVVVHMYTATAPTWREVVLGVDRDALADMVLAGAAEVHRLVGDDPRVRFEFSPEVFNLTEPDYVLDLCDRVTALWDARPERPVILNLPATVEVATPNVYADQIEHVHRGLARRDGVILSVHPHDDRGTGVACAELAVLAGAQRVEGCLFGNGERTGNVDLVTLALNLHAQGVDPMIDFSDIDEIRRTVEHCNRIAVHERHPYVGDLVHTAFSGTHQDAISKGFAHHRAAAAAAGVPESEAPWDVPYLPIDPADVGRDYDAVIRVNSQSGKGGIAYLLRAGYGLELPRPLQIDFSRHVQHATDASGAEATAAQLWELFTGTYLAPAEPLVTLHEWQAASTGDGHDELEVDLTIRGERAVHHATGAGPVDALTRVLGGAGLPVEVLGLTQQSLEGGSDARAITYVEHRCPDRVAWAAGLGTSVLEASLAAVVAAACHRAASAS
ncbi:2-isopropylmalate synthase [Pseudonocardia kunmingensis]|uniref:2-isopropylmalate synthase n=1 Tax=Pseudonocardia kunmingensis TaxID=630975 RepID=A0A543E037_9PSEU|nr:2-isopropylmalate synthase [Pseudonocardia kunmingensis]TQM14938.1 2-isopropylmalate synthase [Pseudonocardia kunmingensis]